MRNVLTKNLFETPRWAKYIFVFVLILFLVFVFIPKKSQYQTGFAVTNPGADPVEHIDCDCLGVEYSSDEPLRSKACVGVVVGCYETYQ